MELVNNRYSIQGVDVEALAEKFGAPLYVYDADKIEAQFNTLNDAFSSK